MTRRPSIEFAEMPQCSINRGVIAGRSEFTAAECETRHKCWLEVNKDAIASYNQRVEDNGVFSDGLRLF